MKLTVTITPKDMFAVLKELNEESEPYSFAVMGHSPSGRVVLRLEVDASPSDHNIVLNDDGTWYAQSKIEVVKEEPQA